MMLDKAKAKKWEVIDYVSHGNKMIVIVKRENAPMKDYPYSVHDYFNDGFYSGSYDLTKEEAKSRLSNRLKK